MADFNLLNALFNSICVSTLFLIINSKVLNYKIVKKWPAFISYLILIITILISGSFFDNAFKVMAIYSATIFINKFLFKKPLIQCAASALISYLLLSAGEVFVVILISLATKFNIINNALIFKDDTFINLLISLSGYFFLLLTYRNLRKLVTNIKENNKLTYIFAFSLLIFAICALLYSFFSNDYKINNTFIVNLLLIIFISYIGLIMIKQIYDKNKIIDEYERYVTYSKQSEKLVEQFSISQHENKNELIIIRSMVHKTNKKLLEYLNEIISNKDNVENSWIRYLRYIPFGGLKGIIHNKISEMKDNNITVFLNISSDVEKSWLKSLTIKENDQLTKIIGVFLDNAKEAAMITNEKEVSIFVYLENKNIVFEISNSCDSEVDVDSIYESGNTSKGKGRGYGLYLVKSIIDGSKMFSNETRMVDGYFVQKLKVVNKKREELK